ncbi:TetR/AcrR family transcriptional regulator [Altericroceibacterium spongiae]|nr:TetR/AcrR family transcriptional regulator [Altericroceibacterium spongiae]
MTQSPSIRRGRPRSFDRDKALREAMLLFWENGYEGTSMAQLVEAMGIVSPSIYAAFGSKEDLFREAVRLYVATEVEPAWQALDEITDVQQAVRTMLLGSIEAFVATRPQRGCLVVLGSGLLGGADDTIRDFLREQRQHFRDRLVKCLQRAIDAGTFRPDNDPWVLADCVLAFFAGLTIEAVDGAEKAALRESAELFCLRMFDER